MLSLFQFHLFWVVTPCNFFSKECVWKPRFRIDTMDSRLKVEFNALGSLPYYRLSYLKIKMVYSLHLKKDREQRLMNCYASVFHFFLVERKLRWKNVTYKEFWDEGFYYLSTYFTCSNLFNLFKVISQSTLKAPHELRVDWWETENLHFLARLSCIYIYTYINIR